MKQINKEVETTCPFCNKKGEFVMNEILIKDVREATTLMMCEELHIWGRGT